jgi:hypothetical protein
MESQNKTKQNKTKQNRCQLKKKSLEIQTSTQIKQGTQPNKQEG